MRFANPWLLLLGLLAPLAVYSYLKQNRSGQLIYSDLGILKGLKRPLSVSLRHGLIALRVLALLLLAAVVARPQSGRKTTEIITEGVDIMLLLDTSGSMQAMDFKLDEKRVNRLEVVKKVVGDFIKARENDRMGMVVFGEEAFTQCPLTLDQTILLQFLESVEIGMAGDGTAIGSAIGIAVKRLKDLRSKSKVIILLTDGRNNAGRLPPLKAAQLAQKYNIKTYTVGAGTKGPAPFLVNTFFGPQYMYQQVDIDEDILRELAKTTGGTYFRATDTESLQEVYEAIDKMEKSEVKVKEHMEYKELYAWPLSLALIFLLAEILLANTRFRKMP